MPCMYLLTFSHIFVFTERNGHQPTSIFIAREVGGVVAERERAAKRCSPVSISWTREPFQFCMLQWERRGRRWLCWIFSIWHCMHYSLPRVMKIRGSICSKTAQVCFRTRIKRFTRHGIYHCHACGKAKQRRFYSGCRHNLATMTWLSFLRAGRLNRPDWFWELTNVVWLDTTMRVLCGHRLI